MLTSAVAIVSLRNPRLNALRTDHQGIVSRFSLHRGARGGSPAEIDGRADGSDDRNEGERGEDRNRYGGRPEESVPRLKKAMLLNPHDQFRYAFHLGQAYYVLRRYEEAIETFQRGIKRSPRRNGFTYGWRLHLRNLGRLRKPSGKPNDSRPEPQFRFVGDT
jgi:tetratricopeptide (TPR) repeat protein